MKVLGNQKLNNQSSKRINKSSLTSNQVVFILSIFILVIGSLGFILLSPSITWGVEDIKKDIRNLGNPDIAVRQQAVIKLGKLKDKRAVPALIERLKDEDDNVRALAVRSLGKIKSSKATVPLMGLLNNKRRIIKIEAIKALGEIGDKKAVRPLAKILNSKDAYLCCLAATSLGKLGDNRGLKIVLKEVENEDSKIRVKAILALKDINIHQRIQEVLSVLMKATNDQDKRVKAAANLVLEYFGIKR